MDVNGKLAPTMEGRPYTIYRLTRRERCDHPIEGGPWAFRVGPEASGALAQYVQGVKNSFFTSHNGEPELPLKGKL